MPVPRVTIVGAPNAGKSTLFNRLVGRRKALIHKEPGMTRDVNEEACDWDGLPVTLVDTGGLFPPGESGFAGLVRESVRNEAVKSDILILLVDGRLGLTPLDSELARMFRETGRPIVVAVNKLDVPGRTDPAAEFHRLGFDGVVAISAEHGLGIDELIEAVAARLRAGPAPAAQEEISTRRDRTGEIRLAICGRPNVGKSSLLNALLGEQRTLVSEVPGTTRDAIDCLLHRDGRTYRIIDTAGIRRSGRPSDKPEILSVMAARRSVERADVVLLLMDATEAPTLQDLHVAGIAHEASRPFMVLLNKWDLVGERRPDRSPDVDPEGLIERVRGRLRFAPWAPVLAISALTKLRVNRILPAVEEIHAQATQRLGTGKLNAWLLKAVEAHRPPAIRGRDLRFFYVSQKGTNPPSLVIFTNNATPPHFSYQRYLENSIRERFGLTRTPVLIQYRERPRRTRASGTHLTGRRGRPV
ncbi:MAG TPA: ribosome biogenesis GTPase Der [Thermoplasmata archaeon]|nr:ribosome biogenesis GTPase Der [Thermoplasmata archaeon]